MKKMDPVVHFEMPYEDKNRMADFYKNVFGWAPQMLGPEMGNYVVMHTSEIDPKTKFPTKPGRINGGFYKKPEDKMGQAPSVVIAVENVDEKLKEIKKAGGKIMGEPMDIPGIGRYGSFVDTEGNRVSVITPMPM